MTQEEFRTDRRGHVARYAFHGDERLEDLTDKILDHYGYEENGMRYSANGYTQEDCLQYVDALPEAEVIAYGDRIGWTPAKGVQQAINYRLLAFNEECWTINGRNIVVESSPEEVICQTPEREGVPTPADTANARVIASAPDLLRACEEALKQLSAIYRESNENVETDERLAFLKNAIAKATNKPPRFLRYPATEHSPAHDFWVTRHGA